MARMHQKLQKLKLKIPDGKLKTVAKFQNATAARIQKNKYGDICVNIQNWLLVVAKIQQANLKETARHSPTLQYMEISTFRKTVATEKNQLDPASESLLALEL